MFLLCSSIGDRIRLLRKTLNLTQEMFGQLLGVSQRHISQLEKGTRDASEQLIKHMCLRFHTSEFWLTTGEGEMFLTPEEVIKNQMARLGERAFMQALANVLEERGLALPVFRPSGKNRDPALEKMISFFIDLWSLGNEKLQAWAQVQFERAFPPDIQQDVQKKITEQQDCASTG